MIGQDNRYHCFGYRNKSRQQAWIMTAFYDYRGWFTGRGYGLLFAGDGTGWLHGAADNDRHPGRYSALNTTMAVCGSFNPGCCGNERTLPAAACRQQRADSEFDSGYCRNTE
jgi:hypothetical protein